LNVAINSGDA